MTSPIITVDGISKAYRIGLAEDKYPTFREALMGMVKAPFRRFQKLRERTSGDDIFWALKDVSFEVRRGEVVGIIGRNGAGKSTLLKILSRITEPTEGTACLRGRVASLLEVGTGFHPDLSGRENIYLNGAILGMKKAEIDRKFDEIVDFSGIEKFIDTPVKHYSSGMGVRLAFAVAAHLEPEIMLVDEVLAVGDASFQRKCLNRMEGVSQEGRTVFFVSHNIPAITRLCPRTILLDEGRILRDGPSHQVVASYLKSGVGTTASREWADLSRAPGNDIVRMCSVRVVSEDGQVTEAVDIRRPIGIEMQYEVLKAGRKLVPNFHFFNAEGLRVFIVHDQDPSWRRRPRPRGRFASTAWIPGNFLAEGMHVVQATISTHDPVVVHANERDAVAFQVIDSTDGDTARGDYAGTMPGAVRPLLRWTTRFDPDGHEPQDSVTEDLQ